MKQILSEIWHELSLNDVTHPDTAMWYRKGNAFLAHVMAAIWLNTFLVCLFTAPSGWVVGIQTGLYFLGKEVKDLRDGGWQVLEDSLTDTWGFYLGLMLPVVLVQGYTISTVIALALILLSWFSFPYRELAK